MEAFIPTARLLLRAFRGFESDLLARLAGQGYADVTLSHLNVLRHLDPEGLGLSALADEAAMTKQAVSKIVADLADKGYLAVHPHPTDRRGKHVAYTRRGERMIALAVALVGDMEGDYRRLLGDDDYHALRRCLSQLIDHHGSPNP